MVNHPRLLPNCCLSYSKQPLALASTSHCLDITSYLDSAPSSLSNLMLTPWSGLSNWWTITRDVCQDQEMPQSRFIDNVASMRDRFTFCSSLIIYLIKIAGCTPLVVNYVFYEWNVWFILGSNIKMYITIFFSEVLFFALLVLFCFWLIDFFFFLHLFIYLFIFFFFFGGGVSPNKLLS